MEARWKPELGYWMLRFVQIATTQNAPNLNGTCGTVNHLVKERFVLAEVNVGCCLSVRIAINPLKRQQFVAIWTKRSRRLLQNGSGGRFSDGALLLSLERMSDPWFVQVHVCTGMQE